MSNSQKLSKLTVHDYLAFEESAQIRHEFVDGQIFAMTGGSQAHNVLSLNIATMLRSKSKGSDCTVYMADMKVRIEILNRFYYPDVLLDCGAFEKASVVAGSPVSIFEVLSRSTAGTDRREKLVAYQQIDSLKHYVIVHQTRQRLEVYRRSGIDWTVQEIVGSDEQLVLEACPDRSITISMNDIYADIEFDEGPDLQVREDVEVYTW